MMSNNFQNISNSNNSYGSSNSNGSMNAMLGIVPPSASFSPTSNNDGSLPLMNLGIELLLSGRQDGAMALFDAAHHALLTTPTPSTTSLEREEHKQILSHIMDWANQLLSQQKRASTAATSSFNANSATPPPPPPPPPQQQQQQQQSSCHMDTTNNHDQHNEDECQFATQLPIDTYHEDECDVGPRPFSAVLAPSDQDRTALELFIAYNRALVHHSRKELGLAMSIYTQIVAAIQPACTAAAAVIQCNNQTVLKDLYYLAMVTYNNMGQICYSERSEDSALVHFESALSLVQLIAIGSTTTSTTDSNNQLPLDCATVLSNWCRARWMTGDVCENVHQALGEVLRIRTEILGWDHVDVAAAHYNLGVTNYARCSNEAALQHLTQYLTISSHRIQTYQRSDLDPIPALIYVLLIKNENATTEHDAKIRLDIVRGLRSLQEKRQDLGPHHPEVASILNYVGTLLFHQRDLDHALLFFQEELQLEEEILLEQQLRQQRCTASLRSTATACTDDEVSVSVTCNNIGRILQELGRFSEAIFYYQRSLKPEFGELTNNAKNNSNNNNIKDRASNTSNTATNILPDAKMTTKSSYQPVASITAVTDPAQLSPATMNLYSTVWYNLGLIHDKMGAYPDAIRAFQMSLMLRRTMLGSDHADVACLLYNIGVLQMEQHILNDATDSFREALRIRRVASTGQLNDRHVIKTLQKLASLHKAKRNIQGALEACNEVLRLLGTSQEVMEPVSRAKNMASTLLEVSDLHHSHGDTSLALTMATRSVQVLQNIRASGKIRDLHSLLEQETAGLLLIGSLQHELCEPVQAQNVFAKAAQLIQYNLVVAAQQPTINASNLRPLLEVSNLLAQSHCAPEA